MLAIRGRLFQVATYAILVGNDVSTIILFTGNQLAVLTSICYSLIMQSSLYTSSQTDLIKRIRGHLKLGVHREKDHAQCILTFMCGCINAVKIQWEKKPIIIIVSGCDEA